VLALPVADASQDMVLAEHVLEHVVDPVAACREIERVLRPGGVVLAKVPFNYPWHGGYVDFFRFTPAGFLAAFRTCEAVHVGHGPGPFSSVAYLLQHDWVSMFTGRRARRVAAGAGRLGLGWLKHLDRFVIHRPGSLGATTTLVFVGRRGTEPRSAQEVVAEARRLGAAPVGPPPVVGHC
jgi:SAM-dependent methyltransferase